MTSPRDIIAKALEEAVPHDWVDVLADATLAALSAAGYVICPREASEAMCDAFVEAHRREFGVRPTHGYFKRIWTAMLQAAQQGETG